MELRAELGNPVITLHVEPSAGVFRIVSGHDAALRAMLAERDGSSEAYERL